MQQAPNSRWLRLGVPAAIIAAFLLFVGLAMNIDQPVAADPLRPDLPPPLSGERIKFDVALPASMAASEAGAVSPAADTLTTVMTETFEASVLPENWTTFDANKPGSPASCTGTIPGTFIGDYCWGQETSLITMPFNGPSITMTNGVTDTGTVWAVGDGFLGEDLDPITDTYPSTVDTWLVYGPLDLKSVLTATVAFDYWYDGVDGEQFRVGFVTGDPGNVGSFEGFLVRNEASGWESRSLDISAVSGRTDVYVAFNFERDQTADGRKGPFVDNFMLYLERPDTTFTFLPVMRRDPTPIPTPTPVATATPEPGTNYEFVTEADMAVWRDALDGQGRQRTLGVTTDNFIDWQADESLRLATNGTSGDTRQFVIYSPMDEAPDGDYLITFRARLDSAEDGSTGDDKKEFDVVFGANYNTSASCPETPKFDSCFNDYMVMRFRWRHPGNLEVDFARVVGRDDNGNPKFNQLALEGHPGLNIADWQTFIIKVDRSDGDVKLYLNNLDEGNKLLDVTVTGENKSQLQKPYFGVMVLNNGSEGSIARFDYVRLTQQ